jgi:RNA polymerase sigma-70 factor (ECF subfamily)
MKIARSETECSPSISGQAPIDETDLIKRLKQGQQWACQTLVSHYQDRLLKIAYGITLDHEESREIVQDVFVSAIGKISGFRGDSGLGGWLRKITINACLNWKRKWKRRFRWHHTSLEPDTEFLVYDKASQGETPETRLREKQEEKALSRATHKLPEAIRVVFVLNTLEGLSYKEIAASLGIKEGTVSSRLYRAREMILNTMKEGDQAKGGAHDRVQ